ncbi:hypothetical protein Agub_g7746 [Astrephomene gubernaculifera]|uniref:Ubiquitin-like domain-containing protein n=1 Tax=Astrephomene gubernaculifera TaxID=47775 RepID=A0AAD3DT82_9CHLO|nr:hypothetical protein Agub_g7746 [Astrephomene gubernaculifera]
MASLLVLVAHSGRTLQLDVQPSTRVDAVQHALVSFTGIPVADQIAMYQGARLDPTKPLGAYGLPVASSHAAVEDHPVFLYCRSYLKPGAALPPPEALPPLQVQVPPLAEVNLAHPLHSAPSPLVRALPDYERHFQHHLATTRAYWDVAQARMQRCRQLLSEQEVQARAADAARANVEAHFNYILNSYQTFLDKYNAQHAAHSVLLSTFPADLAALEAIELHPGLQGQGGGLQGGQEGSTQVSSSPAVAAAAAPPSSPPPHQQQQQQRSGEANPLHQHQHGHHHTHHHHHHTPQHQTGQGPGPPAAAAGAAFPHPQPQPLQPLPLRPPPPPPPPRRLADVYPVSRLREWADTCGRSHASLGGKVAELEGLFQLLRRDVEGLFMQAPSVDLDGLGRELAEHEALLDEHSSMVQVLSKDLRTVRTLVEDVVRQLGSAAGGGGGGGAGGGGGGGAPGGGGGAGVAGGGGGLRHGALHDAAAAMEAIHETHRNRVLPRLAQLDGLLASFASRLEASKVAMSRELLSQLQRIAAQQSRIRDMRNKLAAFHEVLGRQDAAFGELRVVHRLPSAYRALLAEAVRRAAWHQLYCGQAGRLAEHMTRFREKEAARRTAFAAQVARYLPPDLLTRAGLSSEPPHCQVTVPSPAVPLIHVTMADLARLSYLDERMASLAATAAAAGGSSSSMRASVPSAATAAGGGPPAVHPTSSASSSHHTLHPHPTQPPLQPSGSSRLLQQSTVAVLDADPPPPADRLGALEMENARLRAELANHIAAAAIRELTESTAAGIPAPSAATAAPGTEAPAATPATHGSQQPQSPQARKSLTGEPASGGGGGSGAGSSTAAPPPPPPSSSARRDPAELLAAMQRALGMKDDLIRQQQREAAALAARAAAYEQRIVALEALLAKQAGVAAASDASAASGAAAAVDAVGLGEGAGGDGGEEGTAGAATPVDRSRKEGASKTASVAGEAAAPPPEVALGAAQGAASRVQNGGVRGDVGDSSSGGGGGGGAGAEGRSGAAPGKASNITGGGGCGLEASKRTGSSVAASNAAAGGESETGGGGGAAATAAGAAAVPDDRGVGATAPGAIAAAAGGAGSAAVASPFSLPAAQHAEAAQRLRSTSTAATANLGVIAGDVDNTVSHDAGGPAEAVGVPAPLLEPLPAPQRGPSGPQAIPQGLHGAVRRGGGGMGFTGSPYEHRAPMPLGSLPFATSLPAGASSMGMAGRLASSPGGGIGLGLALGLGLASLAEGGPMGLGSLAGGVVGGGFSRGGSRSGGGGSSRRSSRSSGSGSAGEGCEDMEEEGGSVSLRIGTTTHGSSVPAGSRSSGGNGSSRSNGSSRAASSSGLQFDPSWSAAPVSGDSTAEGDGVVIEEDAAEGGAVGGVRDATAAAAAAAVGGDEERRQQASRGGSSGVADAAIEAGGGLLVPGAASSGDDTGASAGLGAAAGAALMDGDADGGGGAGGEGGGEAHGGGDSEDEGVQVGEEEVDDAADVPDIDEVSDGSGGAWEVEEVASASAPLCAAEGDGAAGDRDGGGELVVTEGGSGGGGGVMVAGEGTSLQQQPQVGGASSGYESAGSVLSEGRGG